MRVIASIALLVSALAAQGDPLPKEPHVYVEGRHVVRTDPDRFEIRAAVSQVAKTAAEANVSVEARFSRLVAKAREIGVAADGISAFDLQVRPETEYVKDHYVPKGIRVTRELEFKLEDVGRAQDLVQAILDANVEGIESVRAYSSHERELRDQAIAGAVANARDRARVIAKDLGRELGPVHSVSEFQNASPPYPFPETRWGVMAAVAADRRSTTLVPGPVEILGQVYVVFTLED